MGKDDKIRKNNPFRVPEGYFDLLTERTMEAIREAESLEDGSRKVILMDAEGRNAVDRNAVSVEASGQPDTDIRYAGKKRTLSLKPFLALAAAILGFAILAAAIVKLIGAEGRASGYEPGTSLYADLAFEELDAYTLENELAKKEPVTEIPDKEEISSETIIEYLMTEDIDLNDIYELL